MIEVVEIPKQKLKLLRFSGYMERYFELIPVHQTYEQAWEALENELFSYFEINRYNSYNSFRSSRLKRKLCKHQKRKQNLIVLI
jgi:hypothetical protein